MLPNTQLSKSHVFTPPSTSSNKISLVEFETIQKLNQLDKATSSGLCESFLISSQELLTISYLSITLKGVSYLVGTMMVKTIIA